MVLRFIGPASLRTAALVFGLSMALVPAWAEEPPKGERPLGDPPSTARVSANGNDAWLMYDSPRLRYEQPRFAGDARLFVREDVTPSASTSAEATSAARWRVYRGRDLDAITQANADLSTSTDMRDLRTYLQTNSSRAADQMQVAGTVRTSVESPGFVYEPDVNGTSRLFVRDAQGRETLYTGSDFDTIVRTNPSVGQLQGFESFRTRVRTIDGVSPWIVRSDSPTVLSVNHTPTGVTVLSNEWRDGRWVSRNYQGRTLEEIRTNQADLRGLLDGRDDSGPMTVPASNESEVSEMQTFGASLEAPRSCLNSQLGLEGRGVVVTQVQHGSNAYNLGLRRDDVIVEYDGRPVTDVQWVRSQFSSWRSESRSQLVVLRGGSRVTLGR